LKEKERDFTIGVLTGDEKVTEALSKRFESKENITIVDLMHMDSETAKKFINTSKLDIVITAEDSFVDAKNRRKIDELIKADQDTTFFTIYYSENAKTMLEINKILSVKKILIAPCKIETTLDYKMMTTNIQGSINKKIKDK